MGNPNSCFRSHLLEKLRMTQTIFSAVPALTNFNLTTTTMQNSRVYLGPFGHLHRRNRLCPRPAHRKYSIKYYYIRGSTNWYRQPVALEGTSKQVTTTKTQNSRVYR